MDVDVPEARAENQLPGVCLLCEILSDVQNKTLTDFIVGLAKTASITVIIHRTREILPMLLQKQDTTVLCNTECIMHHLLYCVAIRDPGLLRMVCSTITMKTVLHAQSQQQTLSAIKLLLHSVQQDKNTSV